MRKKLVVVAATVVAFTALLIAPAEASVPILYQCSNTHLSGWTEVITTRDRAQMYWLSEFLGYSCVCIADQ